MGNTTIWISYDLGVTGDYEGLYQWLDQQEAKECGDNLATLKYKHSGALIESLKNELKNSIVETRRTRIYVIYRDAESKKFKGAFIFGGRKTPAWFGFAGRDEDSVDEEL